MDKNAIKKYAVWARRELIERVSQRAMIYGITAKDAGDPNAESVNGHLLSQAEKRQRQALIRNIKTKGYEQVMEEVAYTWFNRFAALRFMEVNGYLPSHIRVFTNDAGEFKPQILAEAIHLELDGLDMNKVYELESANKSEELFKYLLIVQCNALNSILPGMFQRIDDYTELLLPDYLLREGSVIEQMVTSIPEEDWTDQVQIIGWLYQYYNTELKDKVFADLKKNIKISKENIPAATQLFTPDWIVHYMVENSLGRLWLEGHPNDSLKSKWKYFIDEAEQEPEVQAQLDTVRKEYASLKPEEIRVIDPCMGSGHILCVLFDTLVHIYEDYGYTAREAAVKIVENNLWGLDIDERAAQLSYFAVMMKARQYDRRFFTRKVQPHVYAIEESNGIINAPMHDMGLHLTDEEYGEAVKQAMRLVEEMHDAKEYGSIIHVTPCDWDLLRRFAVPRDEDGQLYLDMHGEIEASARLQLLVNVGEALAQKYHTVVTNPPYMNSSGMNNILTNYVKNVYPNGKTDMFGVFTERCLAFMEYIGFVGLITQPSLLFLSSFSKLREKIVAQRTIVSLLHMGRGIFGIDFGSTAFVLNPVNIEGYKGSYFRLHKRNFQFIDPDDIEDIFTRAKYDHALSIDYDMYNTETGITSEMISAEGQSVYYTNSQKNFEVIPGSPVAYWLSDDFFSLFTRHKRLRDVAKARSGAKTGNNNLFLRMWWEVIFDEIERNAHNMAECIESRRKWFPHNKGGNCRDWYGNREIVIDFRGGGQAIKENALLTGCSYDISAQDVYFHEGVTWSGITSVRTSFRYSPYGCVFDSNKGPMLFAKSHRELLYILSLLCSPVAGRIFSVLNPTVSIQNGDIDKLPYIYDTEMAPKVELLAEECVRISSSEWDAFETSWDFQHHPFITLAIEHSYKRLEECWIEWNQVCDERFYLLKENEECINRMFISIYGLKDELVSNVDDKDVTIRKANLQRETRSFISYAVGCMFGRYALGKPGLAYAGGEWDISMYDTFQPDKDAIIPICDDEYFEDDIVGRFVKFVEVVYGIDTLEENLSFIADALGGKGSSREVIRSYFINDFYSDHLKVYQKRPIYWLFDSGKKNGFKCLIYMHRYQPDTIARIRTDYVHEQQSRYRTAIADLEQRINSAPTSERVKLNKRLTKLKGQAEEIRVYEEKIHHLADQMIKIDLDDGVKHNYAIFKDVLAKIK